MGPKSGGDKPKSPYVDTTDSGDPIYKWVKKKMASIKGEPLPQESKPTPLSGLGPKKPVKGM